ncbi:hypothetical protein M9Y10_043305 [Tritrichomonas musculus]|uniref:Bromo domain-containing protein n=1 Tax=Tritrichomonas musculus TaxID=1915356 RepID=A0ABR2JZH9_9EUKA
MFNIPFTQTSIDHALQIMEKLAQLPCAKPFLLPVDPVRDQVPNYYHVVTRPIDISLINEKLLLIKYTFVHEWVRDMFLIRDNAKLFNGSNSFIYLLARRLIEHFEHELKGFYIYNAGLWTKRYQELSKKLQDQMKQFPVVLSSQNQNIIRPDQLISQNISSLILNESQSHRLTSLPLHNNISISPKILQDQNMNSKIEPDIELPANYLSEDIQISQRNSLTPKQSDNHLIQPVIETNRHPPQAAPAEKFETIFDQKDIDFAFSKEQRQTSTIFKPQQQPQPQTSIFGIGKEQKLKASSIFGDLDPLSLPPILPMGDTPPPSSNNNSLQANPMKATNSEIFPPSKPAISTTPTPVNTFSNSPQFPLHIPQSAQQPIFPQQPVHPHYQPDSRHRPNFYGINNLKPDPLTISPPEIGPIVNTKQNMGNDSQSPLPFIPESTMTASLTSTSSMNNMDTNSNITHSLKFINTAISANQMTEQKKLFIMRYISLFNNFTDMMTIYRIISIHEPQYSFTNNEIDLAAISPSTVNELANFMHHKMNSSKSGFNRVSYHNTANNNLDT